MTGRTANLLGMRFGRLEVVSFSGYKADSSGHGYAMWNCICNCGAIKSASAHNLKSGDTRSCGCLSREAARKLGLAKRIYTPEWSKVSDICSGAKSRCDNQNHKRYEDYGGRGIKFGFRSVREMTEYIIAELGERPSRHHSLDRIDNDKGYERGNLRWATRKEQNANTRRRRIEEMTYRDIVLELERRFVESGMIKLPRFATAIDLLKPGCGTL